MISPDNLRRLPGAVSGSLSTRRCLTEQLFALVLVLGVWAGGLFNPSWGKESSSFGKRMILSCRADLGFDACGL